MSVPGVRNRGAARAWESPPDHLVVIIEIDRATAETGSSVEQCHLILLLRGADLGGIWANDGTGGGSGVPAGDERRRPES